MHGFPEVSSWGQGAFPLLWPSSPPPTTGPQRELREASSKPALFLSLSANQKQEML